MRENGISILVVPEGGRSSRTYRLTRKRLRLLSILTVTIGGLAAVGMGSWWFLAVRAARVAPLERRVAELESETQRVRVLASQLSGLEEQYTRLLELVGTAEEAPDLDLWIPAGRRRVAAAAPDEYGGAPTSWPLATRGFITQPLLAGAEGEHPGLDIATPTDSYVRAAAPGTVAEVGQDSIYGRYLFLDHAEGYRTVYAHTSSVLVEEGRQVRRNEVIALSGSTGRSTAPHLHFEILKDGEPVDPLSMVTQP